MSYEPSPGSVPFRVLAHMELLHKGSEITTGMLGTALGVDSNGLATQLGRAVEARLLFVRQKGGHLKSPKFWSLVDHSTDAHAAPPPGPQTALQRVTKVLPIAATSHQVHELDIDAIHRKHDRVIEMDTPPEGANRDASAEQSHDAAESETSSGRGTNGAFALGAAPVFLPDPVDPPSPSIARAMKVRQLRTTSRPAPAPVPVPEGMRQLSPDNTEDIRVALWSDGTLEIRAFDSPTMMLRRQQARQLVDYLNAIDLDLFDEEPVA